MIPSLPQPEFTGFPPGALRFFKELAENNRRDWFESQRSRYETEILDPLKSLVTTLADRLAAEGLPLRGTAKGAIFRIHRDTRFSKDKSPYKTHAGAVLTRDGQKDSPGLLYLHLDPKEGFLASGFYMPEPPDLSAIRSRMLAETETWEAILADLIGAGLSLDQEHMLKRLPQGFSGPEAERLGDSLRLKSFTLSRPQAATAWEDAAILDHILDFARLSLPLLQFGWRAIQDRTG